MFLQNQIKELPNHYKIIKDQVGKSTEIRLIVAYIRKNGVEALKDLINKEKNVKLLFSFDMAITDPKAILELLELGVEVKVYQTNKGTFHPKVWLFKRNDKWSCIVGSANLTRPALFDNVEASVFIDNTNNFNGIIEQSIMFFNYLWNSENSKNIDKKEINAWINKLITRSKIKKVLAEEIEPSQTVEVLLKFVKSWIEIDKSIKEKGVIGSLWRGWYIIPDQGYISDDLISRIFDIVKIIKNKSGSIDISKGSKDLKEILEITSKKFIRDSQVMDDRDIFIRQEKNYLLKFGLVVHPIKQNGKPDKGQLVLTSLGSEFANCTDLDCIKELYTNFMLDYTYNGLKITKFTYKLLKKFQHIDFDEFSLFVIHTYTEDEFDEIVKLIYIYRNLSIKEKTILKEKYNEMFKKIKEPTAKNVKGNYHKKVKHTMSAIGWCKDIKCDFINWKIEIIDHIQ